MSSIPSITRVRAWPSRTKVSAETEAEAGPDARLTEPSRDSPAPTTALSSVKSASRPDPRFWSGCGMVSLRQPSFRSSASNCRGEETATLRGSRPFPISARIVSSGPASAILLRLGVEVGVQLAVERRIDAVDDQVLAHEAEVTVAGSRVLLLPHLAQPGRAVRHPRE